MCFNFVAAIDYESILTTKISRFTVHMTLYNNSMLCTYFRCLDGIPECVVAQFHEAAEELIREKGATSAVAAALAYIAGAKDIVSRSLLSAHQVHVHCVHHLQYMYCILSHYEYSVFKPCSQ